MKKVFNFNKFPSIRKLLYILFIYLCLKFGLNKEFCLKNKIDAIKSVGPTVGGVDTNWSSISNEFENLSFDELPALNETGFQYNIVPNLVHYVLFGVREITFSHFISILSALKNQKPDVLYIHCNCRQLSGNYYRRLLAIVNKTKTKFIIRTVVQDKVIFGRRLNRDFLNWHSSDIMRNRVLQEFGGIYLDRDVYVVQSLDVFRKFEMTLNWDQGQYFATQTLVANKNARFLKLWLDLYHDYRRDKWYFNAGELPTTAILKKRPELVHRVKGEFGADTPVVCPLIFKAYYPDWNKRFYAIHLTLRGYDLSWPEWCFGQKYNWPPIVRFDENISKALNVTFGEMTRILFDFEKSLIS